MGKKYTLLIWAISENLYFSGEYSLGTSDTLGSTMNIWKDSMYKHEDQLFLGIL